MSWMPDELMSVARDDGTVISKLIEMDEAEVTDVCKCIIDIAEPENFRPCLRNTLNKDIWTKKAFVIYCITGHSDEMSGKVRKCYLEGKFGERQYNPISIEKYVAFIDRILSLQKNYIQDPEKRQSFVESACNLWQ